MPGMFVHSGHLWGMAREARDRAIAAVRSDPEVCPSDATVAIILATASAEAFINEFAEMVAMERDSRTGPGSIFPQLRAFADALEEVEEARGNLQLKYLVASQTLSGHTFNKGENPFQDFATLVTLRNDIMHLKPRDTFGSEAGGGPITIQPPKYVKGLQQRGLAHRPEGDAGMSWFNMLQTQEMAIWACRTALNIILAVLDLIPDGSVLGHDPSEMFKRMFRRLADQA